MAIHASSTTASARPLLPLRGPDGRFAKRAEARAELPPEPFLPADAPSADEVLDDMAHELDRQGVPRGPAPLPSLSDALARRRAVFGAVTLAVPVVAMTTTTLRCHDGNDAVRVTHTPDPAFAAVRAFDQAVAEWDAAFGEYLVIMDALDPAGVLCWDDPPAVARAVLGPIAGPSVAALDRLLRRMEALDARHEAAEARLLSTRATSEVGAAALRAAVRRYARRPYGCRSDEAVMLAQIAA